MNRFNLPALLAALSVPATLHAQPAPPPDTAPDQQPVATIENRLRALIARPGGLTSAEVAARAAATSFDVRAKEHEVRAAAAEMDKALVAWFPRLTLTAGYTRLSPITAPSFAPSTGNLVATPAAEGALPPGAPLVSVPASELSFPVILNRYTLQAALVVPISDYVLRTSQSYGAASHSRQAAQTNVRAAKLAAALQGRVIYYSWARAQLQQVVAGSTLDQARTHLSAAQVALSVHRVSKADVLRTESQVASSELLVERSRAMTDVATEQLRTVIHDASNRRYEIGEDLLAPLPEVPPGEFHDLYMEALSKRLEIRALDQTAWSLRQQRRAVSAGNYPRLDAFGNAYYANPNPRYLPEEDRWHATWDAGVQLTWTPNDIGTSTAAANSIHAQTARIEAQKEALKDALRSEVMQAYQDTRAAQVAIGTTERALAAAEEAYRVRTELFTYGRATNIELVDAETELLRARLEMINARVDLRVARARLDHAVGRDVK